MRTSVSFLAILFSLFTIASQASAQTSHTAPAASLDAALQEHVDAIAADRQLVQRVLDNDDVRAAAGSLGIDMRRAKSAVANLQGEELTRVAEQARQVDQALAGGQSRVVLSTTMIIIGLLVLILIIVAVD